MLRFIHAADVHLDSPLLGLDSYEGAPSDSIRRATRTALEKLVDLALAERVALVLLAGDLYDGDWRDASTGLFFIAQMSRLDQARIPVILVSGNHDAASRITGRLPYPRNVQVFPVEQASTIHFDALRVAVHGQGYARQVEDRNLAASYPPPLAGCVNIGLLHTALEGREGHEPYAPCTLSELIAKGYDYWALGHVHQRESANGSNHPRVEYAGNLQGRHIRETGAKGCLLVTVRSDGRCEPDFRPLDVFRWVRLPLEVSTMGSTDEIVDAVASGFFDALSASDGRALGVRVELFGKTSLHETLEAETMRLSDELRSRAIAESSGRLWVEKLVIRTSRLPASPDVDSAIAQDALTEISGVIADLRADPQLISSLLKEGDCGELFKKLPQECRIGPEGEELTSASALGDVSGPCRGNPLRRFEGYGGRLMKFLSVTLRKFGPFLEQRFDFDNDERGLHLVFGPNEAGKSSALRGLRYFLFGFPSRSNDDFVFKTSQFRIEATLENVRGDVLECIRRKGLKETLRAGDDKAVVSDETLRSFMGGLSEEQFKQLFGLDHQLLDDGGRLIAQGKGHLGEALFAAGAGLAGLRHLRAALDEKKDAIYKPRGQAQLATIQIRRLKELRDQIQSASLAAETYAAKDEELRAAAAAAERGRQERDRARAEHGKLERFRAALPIIDQLRSARESLSELATARTLAEGFEKDYREIATSLIALQAAYQALQSDIRTLDQELESLPLPEELLGEEESIERIKEKVAVWSREKDEALKSDTRRREAEAKARDIFRSLTGSTDLDQAKNYRLTIEQISRIRDLARERARLQGEWKHSCQSITKSEREIAALERKLLASPRLGDLAGLKAALDLVAREGRIDEQLAELRAACARTNQDRRRAGAARSALFAPCRTVRHSEIPAGRSDRLASARALEAEEAVRSLRRRAARCPARTERARRSAGRLAAGRSRSQRR